LITTPTFRAGVTAPALAELTLHRGYWQSPACQPNARPAGGKSAAPARRPCPRPAHPAAQWPGFVISAAPARCAWLHHRTAAIHHRPARYPARPAGCAPSYPVPPAAAPAEYPPRCRHDADTDYRAGWRTEYQYAVASAAGHVPAALLWSPRHCRPATGRITAPLRCFYPRRWAR